MLCTVYRTGTCSVYWSFCPIVDWTKAVLQSKLAVNCNNQIKSNHKSLLLSYHHSTCALVSEILESVLQTVQKQFTYRQYILTDLSRKTMCRIHIHVLSTNSVLLDMLSNQYTLYTICTHSTLCTHIYTQ